MIRFNFSLSATSDFFRASMEFWCCALAGSFLNIIIFSLQVFYWGGSYAEAIATTAKISLWGIFILLTFRYYYFKRGGAQLHPTCLIPTMCIVALLFSTSTTLFTFFYNNDDYRDFGLFLKSVLVSPASNLLLNNIVGFFLICTYVMLSWLMVYAFIQAERSTGPIKPLTKIAVCRAGFFFLLTHLLTYSMTFSAFNTTPTWLFSPDFLWDYCLTIFTGIFLLFPIFLIKPKAQFFNSRLLPLLPTIMVLVFCSSVLSAWILKLKLHIHYAAVDTSLAETFSYIAQAITGKVLLWKSADEFAGTLWVKYHEQSMFSLLLLYYCFSPKWQRKSSDEEPPHLDVRKTVLFWIYNSVVWSTVATYLYFFDLLELNKAGAGFAKAYIISFIIFGSLLGAMLRSMLDKFQQVKSTLFIFTYRIAVLSFVFGFLLSCALTAISYLYIYGAFGNDSVNFKQHILGGGYYFYKTFPQFIFCFFVWSLIYELSSSQRNKFNAEFKQLQLEKNMKEIQLNALAGKIDPHFIFNALNNIRALINIDGESARNAILILSDILRNPIANSAQDKIPISEELALVRNYIALAKIQLGNRLEYRESVSEGIRVQLIPSMMLQIMVENAIKHGISQLFGGGVLSLDIRQVDNMMLCRVTNTGTLLSNPSTRGFGVGLKNIEDRLSLLYRKQARFRLFQEHDLVIAELIVPMETQA